MNKSPTSKEGQKMATNFDVHAGRNAFRQISEKAHQMSKDLDEMDLDELRRQQFAIRSFTESVDDADDDDSNWPLPPTKLADEQREGMRRDGKKEEEEEDGRKRMMRRRGTNGGEEEEEEEDQDESGKRRASGPQSECGTMHESSTADTIVEVLSSNLATVSSQMDPSMGETQKYVMRVPGPELVDQEFELHKSLMNNLADEDTLDDEGNGRHKGEQTKTKNLTAKKEGPTASDRQREVMMPHHHALSHPSDAAADPAGDDHASDPSCSFASSTPLFAPRPRPTTPTGVSFLRIESFSAEMGPSPYSGAGVSSRMPPDSFTPKMRVVIPMGRGGKGTRLKDAQRRYSTGQRDICELNAPRGNVAAQTRLRCGSTAAWCHGADIIESDPEYAGKAPPTPVEHRRSSREWHSFGDGEEEVGKAVANGQTHSVDNNGEFVKALEEVRHLIEEVGQEEEINGRVEGGDQIGTNGTHKPNQKLSHSSAVAPRFSATAFPLSERLATETATTISTSPPLPSADVSSDAVPLAAMASSTSLEEADDGDRMGRALIRAAPSPPPAENADQKETTAPFAGLPNVGEFGRTDWHPNDRIGNGTDDYPTDPTPPANPFTTAENYGERSNPFENGEQQPTEQRQQFYDAQQQQQHGHGMHEQQQQHFNLTTYATESITNYNTQQQAYNAFAQVDYGNTPQYGARSEYSAYTDASSHAGYGLSGGDSAPYDAQTASRYGMPGGDSAPYDAQTAQGAYDQYQEVDAYSSYDGAATQTTQLYTVSSTAAEGGTTCGDYVQYGATTQTTCSSQQQQGFVPFDASLPGDQYSDQMDFSKYGTSAGQQSLYSDTTTDFAQYGAPSVANPFVCAAAGDRSAEVDQGEPLDTSVYGAPPTAGHPAAISFLAQPVFPPQRARTPDPFSWEAQENAYQEHGTAIVPKRPPLPPKTPEDNDPTAAAAEKRAEQRDDERATEDEEGEGHREDGTESQRGERKAPPPRPPNAPPPPCRPTALSPARPPVPPSPRPTRKAEQRQQQQQKTEEEEEGKQVEEEEEDAWKRYEKMTERMGAAMKSTEQRLGELGKEMPTPDDAIVREYLSHAGGGHQLTAAQRQQIVEQEAERKRQKQEKKRKKLEKGLGQLGTAIGERVGVLKRAQSPPADPKSEIDLEQAAAELAKKIAAQHGFELDGDGGSEKSVVETEGMASKMGKEEGEEKSEDEKEEGDEDKPTEREEEAEAEEQKKEQKVPGADEQPQGAVPKFEADFSKLDADNPSRRWAAAFEQAALMPPSDSEVDLAQRVNMSGPEDPFDTSAALGGTVQGTEDPFAPMAADTSAAPFDPFEVIPVEELIARAREKAELERAKREAEHEGEFVAETRIVRPGDRLSASHHSSPTPEGGSPVSSMARPVGFEDDFKGVPTDEESPLFDADDSAPLPEFPIPFTGDGWELCLRYPPKKKLMTDRFWKPIYVRMKGNMLAMFTNREETRPAQEILIQANYSLSDIVLQPYDVYTKIHTVKLQHILYKERIGIRPGQISRLVEGHLTKYGLPLEHAAQCTVLAKFGSLNERTIVSFTDALEDVLFRCQAKRETAPTYRQDEVQIHCYDEYEAKVDKEGNVSEQRARVRLFCLAFLSGASFLEVGLNDRRREGKEVVRRKDILPMYTERWIRFEALEFHETVDKAAWEEDQVLRIHPPDGCFFEVMRFRVRPPRNRERPLSVKCVMRMAGSQVELRIDAMAVAHQQRARGTAASTRAVPCEDITVRFPLPEAWIYLFREQRPWGVGSVHSKQRKPGKVKNLRDKLMGTVQHNEPCLIEVGIGEAKYEHLYRALVWRIPRLPERDSAMYKSYMLKCRFELSSFDLMPEQFEPCGVVEFTMPLAVISNTVVRSVAVEQHEDSESVEKFVRYVARCKYSLEIDYQQCADLDSELATAATVDTEQAAEPSRHLAAFNPNDVQSRHDGYRIELPDDRTRRDGDDQNGEGQHNDGGKDRKASNSSSSDEEEQRRAFPVVQIDMKGYGY